MLQTNITNLNVVILMMKRLSQKIKINYFKIRLKKFISIIKIYIHYDVSYKILFNIDVSMYYLLYASEVSINFFLLL
jgi:hypothetical protein